MRFLYNVMSNTQSKIDSLKELNSKLVAEIAELRKENAKLKQIIEENTMRGARVEELEQKNTRLEARLAILEQGEKGISTKDVSQSPVIPMILLIHHHPIYPIMLQILMYGKNL